MGLFAVDMIVKTLEYTNDKKSIDLNSVFADFSFNLELDCDHKEAFQYFNIYRK